MGQTPVGAGLLRPGADGAVEAVFTPRRRLANAVAFAVTIEPDGGVPAPTGDKYLVGLVNRSTAEGTEHTRRLHSF